jgi:hypothetical protein
VQGLLLAPPIFDSGFRGSGPFTKKMKKANALPYTVDFHTAQQPVSTPAEVNCAEPALRARFFRCSRAGYVGNVDPSNFPDSDRLALPRPPNLDVQYRAVLCTCQEKIAKSG